MGKMGIFDTFFPQKWEIFPQNKIKNPFSYISFYQ